MEGAVPDAQRFVGVDTERAHRVPELLFPKQQFLFIAVTGAVDRGHVV